METLLMIPRDSTSGLQTCGGLQQTFRPYIWSIRFGEYTIWVALEVDNALAEQGANRLLPCALGDDYKCMEDDFIKWQEELWAVLDVMLCDKGDEPLDISQRPTVIPEYRVVIHDNIADNTTDSMAMFDKTEQFNEAGIEEVAYDINKPYSSKVMIRRELHSPKSERSCTHIEFDISSARIKYESGDHVGVYAENTSDTVEAAAKLMGYELDMRFTLHTHSENGEPLPGSTDLALPFAGPCSVRTALAKYADLLNPPRKATLQILAQYATNPEEADRLRHLSSLEDKEEYMEWILSAERSLLEVLKEFPSLKVPLGVFFAAVAPRLQPRFYSISSSPLVSPTRIDVTCALVRGLSPTGRLHQGVCSTWMKNALVPASQESNDYSSAQIFVRKSNFRLPQGACVPIVMICAGTGLAPFRAFLQERSVCQSSGMKLGSAILFLRCRNQEQDFLYKEELKQFLDNGALTELHVAFSRQGPKKIYVQHKILEQAKSVWKLISEEGGHLYVCGDAKGMAKDVQHTLIKIIEEQGDVADPSEADYVLKNLQSQGRYLRDIW